MTVVGNSSLSFAGCIIGGGMIGGCGATGGGGYTGPGDIVSGATHWYGLRAYNATYAAATGNIADLVAVTGGAAVCTLKAATDGTADMVGSYCAGTTVPLACAAASGGSCNVTKLYDQVGTSHLTQATLAAMPAFVTGSVTGLASNRPAMQFSGAQSLGAASGGTTTQPLSFSSVAERIGTANGGVIGGINGNDSELRFGPSAANQAFVFAGGTPATRAASDSSSTPFRACSMAHPA
jgi:hypothetical protein